MMSVKPLASIEERSAKPSPATGTVVPAPPVPMLNAPTFALYVDDSVMSRSDSQSPAATVVPVVVSRYQQALWVVLKVIVFTGAEPCAVEATLLFPAVHAVSDAWSVSRSQCFWFPEMSSSCGETPARVPRRMVAWPPLSRAPLQSATSK